MRCRSPALGVDQHKLLTGSHSLLPNPDGQRSFSSRLGAQLRMFGFPLGRIARSKVEQKVR